ncbi:hypothetical protein BGY98DRAFT_936936 [Russula aff. rugulosa BPL654]|nr:hypothetical protein BGY98DRAFT_936936 [Russula aff. rugulosa BPL654]
MFDTMLSLTDREEAGLKIQVGATTHVQVKEAATVSETLKKERGARKEEWEKGNCPAHVAERDSDMGVKSDRLGQLLRHLVGSSSGTGLPNREEVISNDKSPNARCQADCGALRPDSKYCSITTFKFAVVLTPLAMNATEEFGPLAHPPQPLQKYKACLGTTAVVIPAAPARIRVAMARMPVAAADFQSQESHIQICFWPDGTFSLLSSSTQSNDSNKHYISEMSK